MILPAQEIRRRCNCHPDDGWGGATMITPFNERTREHGVTYGVSAAGYDVRIAETVMFNYAEREFMQLASTIEKFDMPDDLVGIVHDKSTWARNGLQVQNTVIEPGWRGYLTLELTWNPVLGGTDAALRIVAGTAIAQIIFHQLTARTEQQYEGKYQDQAAGAQAARFER